MRKVGLIAAAAALAAFSFTADGAFAQGKSAGMGGGGGPRMGGGWAGRPGGGGWAGNPGGGTRWAGRPGGWNGGWHGGHRRYWGPGIGIGIGTGLALGAFAGSPYYGYGYDDDYYYGGGYPADEGVIVGNGAGSPDEVAYCRQRYRSYDMASGTFLGNDGQRHPCP